MLYQLSYPRSEKQKLLKSAIGGRGRIRTFVGLRRQIYSLIPLAAWVPFQMTVSHRVSSFPSPHEAFRSATKSKMELTKGLEPATPCLQGRCSTN